MQLRIELPANLETVLRHRAALSGKDLASYVEEVVRGSVAEDDETAYQMSPDEFARRLDQWIALHPVLDHVVDDSRESIYAGRGE